MDVTKKESDEDPGLTEADVKRGAAGLMKMMFPHLFERAILQAESDEKRLALCAQFSESPFTVPESIARLTSYIEHVRGQEGRREDADILLKYAHKFSHYFINNKAVKMKKGLSIQCLFEGKVFATLGNALNEGFTEWMTRDILAASADADVKCSPDAIDKAMRKEDGTYYFEVKFADALVNMNGKEMLTKAYFGPVEEWQTLSDAVDNALGHQAFLELLFRSDKGNWKFVFDKLRSYVRA